MACLGAWICFFPESSLFGDVEKFSSTYLLREKDMIRCNPILPFIVMNFIIRKILEGWGHSFSSHAGRKKKV
jgi:hypothetical protein